MLSAYFKKKLHASSFSHLCKLWCVRVTAGPYNKIDVMLQKQWGEKWHRRMCITNSSTPLFLRLNQSIDITRSSF